MPKPRPFSRPGITISSGDRKRVWQHLPIEDVAIGDMIAEFGKVATKDMYQDVFISSTEGRLERLEFGTLVHVYTYPQEAPGEPSDA